MRARQHDGEGGVSCRKCRLLLDPKQVFSHKISEKGLQHVFTYPVE